MYTPQMPQRPGGNPWRSQHEAAAEARARGHTWREVAEIVGYTHETVRKYSTLDGFADLVEWFEYRLLEERREKWLKREESLIFDGVEAMHAALIDIMGNEPAEQKYEEILRDAAGDPIRESDTGDPVIVERTKYVYPSPYVRTYAAQTYAKIIGYEEAKRLLAQRAVEPAPSSPADQLDAAAGDYLDADFVDAEIDFPDYEDGEGFE